jgi:hypothetical protein
MSTLKTLRLLPALATSGILAVLSLGPSAQTQAADLAWKFRKGEVLRYELAQKNNMKFETQGQDLESSSTLTINLKWTVDEVQTDGSAKITQTVEHVHVDLATGSQRVSYDSKTDDPEKAGPNDSAETLRTFYTIATTEPYSLTVSPTGEILDAQVPPKLADLIKEYQLQPLADTGSVLSAEGLKRLFVQFFPKLPTQPVEPGSSWNGSLEFPAGPLTLTLQTHYTLESVDAQTAKISGDVNTTLKPRPGLPTTLEVKSQKSSASYAFNTSAGYLDQSAVSQTLNVEAKSGDNTTSMTLDLNVNAKRTPDEK